MNVKLILPALTEAKSPFWRPIKYSLFPPLGLATLAAYLDPEDDVTIVDEHVETLALDDTPELVVIEAYVTSARRSYEIADHYRARGAYVCLGGLHATALPQEAATHADSIFLGPGEDTWPEFLADFRARRPQRIYQSLRRTLCGAPPPRRDLIDRRLYLAPNSLVVSRGCPHSCDFCYKTGFFKMGRSFYLQPVDEALAEIERLPGRHLFFLDDNLFGSPRFATALFDGMRGMGRVWQAAGTVASCLQPGLLEKAAASGLRSLFIGFESLSPENLRSQHKLQNLRGGASGGTPAHGNAHGDAQPDAHGGPHADAPAGWPAVRGEWAHTAVRGDYERAVRRLHDLGVMVNASFVFGMDDDDEGVFERTVEWAVAQGIETTTFHILTPYPGTALHERLRAEGRITSRDWDLYDTRHAVFTPARMSAARLEEGYRQAYRDFYSWSSIARSAWAQEGPRERLRHLAYVGGWKKAEPLWDLVIRSKRVAGCLPLLETILGGPETREAGAALRAAPATDSDPGGAGHAPGAALPPDHLQVTYLAAEYPVNALPATPGMYARTR